MKRPCYAPLFNLTFPDTFDTFGLLLPAVRLAPSRAHQRGLFLVHMTTPRRLVLFIDYQNAYRRARSVFFPNPQSGRDGHLKPMDLGHLIAARGGTDGTPYTLFEVRVYSGRPDQKMDIRTFSAHRKQSQRWRSAGATVIERELRYLQGRPQEKGIDVALAVDFVRLALQGAYDVGVMMSTDNDLLPALETVRDYGPSGCCVEVAAWGTRGQEQRLRLPGLWCHWLDQAAYTAVEDRTRY